jgi:hypothetical protein
MVTFATRRDMSWRVPNGIYRTEGSRSAEEKSEMVKDDEHAVWLAETSQIFEKHRDKLNQEWTKRVLKRRTPPSAAAVRMFANLLEMVDDPPERRAKALLRKVARRQIRQAQKRMEAANA